MAKRKPTKSEEKTAPEASKLKRVLGESYPAYRELLALTRAYAQEWKQYGKNHGWQLKVADKGKALLYLSVQEGSVRVGLAVREKERDALLVSGLPDDVKKDLASVKKFPEGYPLRFSVAGKTDMNPLRIAIKVLMSMRG